MDESVRKAAVSQKAEREAVIFLTAAMALVVLPEAVEVVVVHEA